MTRTSNTILSKTRKTGYPCLVPDLNGNAFVFSLLSMMSAVGLSCCCSVTKSFFTLCDAMDHSPQGSSVHRISQAGILGWVVIFFSRGIFLTQWWNLHILHCRQIFYHLSHKGCLGLSYIIYMIICLSLLCWDMFHLYPLCVEFFFINGCWILSKHLVYSYCVHMIFII